MGQVLLIMGISLGVLVSLTFISCGGVQRVVDYFINKREDK